MMRDLRGIVAPGLHVLFGATKAFVLNTRRHTQTAEPFD